MRNRFIYHTAGGGLGQAADWPESWDSRLPHIRGAEGSSVSGIAAAGTLCLRWVDDKIVDLGPMIINLIMSLQSGNCKTVCRHIAIARRSVRN